MRKNGKRGSQARNLRGFSPERFQELGALIAIRDELMEGDLRALYITWLVGMRMLGSYDEEEDDDIIRVPAVPPALGTLTAAQQALAELWQVPQELLVAAVRHSSATQPSHTDDVVAWVEALPQARRTEYLVRLAKNEPGLSRRLVKELRALGQSTTSATPALGAQVTYAKLLAESKVSDTLDPVNGMSFLVTCGGWPASGEALDLPGG